MTILRQRLRQYPAVGLVGPRQAGKTTLARSLHGTYFDLEQASDRLRLDLQWEPILQSRSLVILDEAQAWPEIFPRLRGAIDADRARMGRFLLLGSVSPSLMVRVSESLAERLTLVELTPLLANELARTPLARVWCRGGYPEGGALRPRRFPQWQRDYLVGAFLIWRLSPYSANLGKRLVKSPKVYWRDTGLLHALLSVLDEEDLLGKPWAGLSWEGFVIEQTLGALQQAGRHCEAYFLRTSDQHEIDLVLDFGKTLWAVEVKLTAAPGPEDLARLNRTADLIKADKRFLVSQTRETIARAHQVSCNLPWLLSHLQTV